MHDMSLLQLVVHVYVHDMALLQLVVQVGVETHYTTLHASGTHTCSLLKSINMITGQF